MNIITTTTEQLNCAIVNIIHCLWFVEHGTTKLQTQRNPRYWSMGQCGHIHYYL